MRTITIIAAVLLIISGPLFAQDDEKAKSLEFDTIAAVKTTPVKDQHISGTCWSYAATSFIETELLRMGKGSFDLSEMFFVKYAYMEKAKNYIQLHGKANFSQGGQAHDVTDVVKEFGMIPEEHYSGMIKGQELPDHRELEKALKGYLDGVLAAKGKGTTEVWFDGFKAILDVYLGTAPETFSHEGKKHKTKNFHNKIGFNPDDYVEITSFNHHPYYKPFRLEIPDNWDYSDYYNLPLDELMQIIDYAFENGFSVCWDGDVSEKFFEFAAGLAVVPVDESCPIEEFTAETAEQDIDQEMRQKHFGSFSTTDDHLMHLTAVIKDESGRKYYVTKNSWAADSNDNNGYLNMSESYLRLNTVAIMVHKDAIPDEIRKKLSF